MSIKSQGHSLILAKGHSDFRVKCLTLGLYTQVSDSGPEGPLVCFRKPKTQKGKRFLEGREPKIFENNKQAMFVKGGNTSLTVTKLLKELVRLLL